tara:strand:+ start:88 stop:675 length:588 start_codon:yes stop_codon:yes gene_type:complete
MKLCIKIFVSFCFLISNSAVYAQEDISFQVEEAREITQKFQKTLKRELQSAIQAGGLKKAVDVCHIRAPEIAGQMSAETGWRIGRTSLKTRNENNAPTMQESDILEQFENRKVSGEALDEMEWWVQKDGLMMYMRAIPMKGICTSCHGPKVNPSLKNHIQQLYPNDTATGFNPGDVRGAFTLQKYLEAFDGQAIK